MYKRQLHHRGYEVSGEVLDREWSEPYQPRECVEQAWFDVYEQRESDGDLYRLGEALNALDDQMAQYRWRHFVLVARIIGHKPGTGGSVGVGWLQQTTGHRYFPELWAVRTRLGT